jgi:hypothetical protein
MLCKEPFEPVIKFDHVLRLRMDMRVIMSLREEAYMSLLHFTNPDGPLHNISHHSIDTERIMTDSMQSHSIVSENEIHIGLGDSHGATADDDNIPKGVEMVVPGDLYSCKDKGVFREAYEFPQYTETEEWVNSLYPLFHDMVWPDGSELAIAEAILICVQMMYFQDRTKDRDTITMNCI